MDFISHMSKVYSTYNLTECVIIYLYYSHSDILM